MELGYKEHFGDFMATLNVICSNSQDVSVVEDIFSVILVIYKCC